MSLHRTSVVLLGSVAWAQTPQAPAPATPSALQPLPRSHGLFELGAPAFRILDECQQRGWGFYPRPEEKVVTRRGARYWISVANVLPPESDEVLRYRLSFLNGRLAGLRVEYRKADPGRFDRARSAHGAPAWEAGDRAEWVASDRRLARTVWRKGDREELVDLGLSRALGFLTAQEIAQELARRKAAAKPPPPPRK